MIEINSNIQHSLGQDEAIARVHRLVASLTERFPQQVHQVKLDMRDHRVDVQFAAYGYVVTFHAEIYDDQVSLTGELPDTAKKFQHKIGTAVVSRLEEALLPSGLAPAA